MKVLASIALLAFTLTGSAPVQARIQCDGFDGGILCYEAQSATITRVGAKFNDGSNFYVDVTCTSNKWMIHGGEHEGFTQTQADEIGRVAAKTWCETHGSHFVRA